MKSDAKPLQIRVLDGEALLPKLCSLDLSFNRLKALRNLNTAKELRELKLYNNRLTATRGLRGNADLEGLFLSENQIEDISADLLALVKLKSLWLKGNRIERVENLKSCRALVFLDLSRNRLAGAASEGLESLTSLETLNLSDNQLRSIGNLLSLAKLEDLNLGNNQLASLEGQFPPNLTALRVNGNRISDLQSLAATLPILNELYIQDNSLSDLEPIASRFPALEPLDIRNNRVRSVTQLQALALCKSLQDIWVVDNPCCLSGSYVLDLYSGLPELKTLDNLSDAQLQSHIEGLKNGSISSPSSQAILSLTPRPHTPPSCRPGTAASRPGSSSGSLGSRPTTPSGRPGTPDSGGAPVFHKPSARIGNLVKLVPQSEIEKAKSDVNERLQKMKDLLQRVGSGELQNSSDTSGDTKRAVAKPQSKSTEFRDTKVVTTTMKASQRTTAEPGELALEAKKDALAPKESVALRSESSGSAKPTMSSSAQSQPTSKTQNPQPRVQKSCVDAGTDPLDSLMGNNNTSTERLTTPAPLSSRIDREIETQTTLPPAPVTALTPVSRSNKSEREQQLQRVSSTEGIQTEPEPQIDGGPIEKEMKEFLMRYIGNNDIDDCYKANNNSSSYGGAYYGDEENQEEARGTVVESPRIEPIKVAEQRQPPNPRSRQGYRTFRMPSSRPSSSSAS